MARFCHLQDSIFVLTFSNRLEGTFYTKDEVLARVRSLFGLSTYLNDAEIIRKLPASVQCTQTCFNDIGPTIVVVFIGGDEGFSDTDFV